MVRAANPSANRKCEAAQRLLSGGSSLADVGGGRQFGHLAARHRRVDQRHTADGGDPGAPVDPKLKKKFVTTTIITTILWVILFLVLHFKLIQLPQVPASWR